MDKTPGAFAYHCLPLVMANSLGWFVINDVPCEMEWDGTEPSSRPARSGPTEELTENQKHFLPSSHFGSGVVTFHAEFMFWTEQKISLITKGPANMPKHGIQSLEGVIETDWLPYPFTMNWKMTAKNTRVRFERGEPIAQIIPYPAGPDQRDRAGNPLAAGTIPELFAKYEDYRKKRTVFNEKFKYDGTQAAEILRPRRGFPGQQVSRESPDRLEDEALRFQALTLISIPGILFPFKHDCQYSIQTRRPTAKRSISKMRAPPSRFTSTTRKTCAASRTASASRSPPATAGSRSTARRSRSRRRATFSSSSISRARRGSTSARPNSISRWSRSRKGAETKLPDLHAARIQISAKKPPIIPEVAPAEKICRGGQDHDLIFGVGPAGTGKTFLAMAMAVAALKNEEVNRIVLTRPAVEAGEALGFLPGDLQEKIFPYLRPLYDALNDMLENEEIQRYMDKGIIEIAPLAYMRGRTLSHSFIILDEAQNTTTEQMFMFLTRLGPGLEMRRHGRSVAGRSAAQPQVGPDRGDAGAARHGRHLLHQVRRGGRHPA